MQEFNKVTTTSNFIKNLLSTTYLPLIRTIREGDYISANRLYIYKCQVIKCTISGYMCATSMRLYSPVASFIVLGEYTFGEKNDKLCTNFISSSEGYDYKTHEHLGKYLRCLRDMYGLNLMPLYNCFSNQPFPSHRIENKQVIKTSISRKTKLYKVPIRFNTDYTICMDNVGITTFTPAFIRYNSLLKLNNTSLGNNIDATNRYISMHNYDVIKSVGGLSFSKPFKIRFDNFPQTKKFKNNYYRGITDTSKIIDVSLRTEDNKINLNTFIKYFHLATPTNETWKANKYYYINDEGLLTLSTSYNSGMIYYETAVNPLGLGWYEKVDNEYILTGDTYIKDSKTYGIKPVEKIATEDKIYDITEENCRIYDSIEDKLYLLIQVPESHSSNIVILEGDYTDTGSTKRINDNSLESVPAALMDYICTSDLKLMEMNTNKITPFSDSLMEYLTWNAINNLDSINNNMDRVAQLVDYTSYIPMNNKQSNNYWYNRYRMVLNRRALEAKKHIFDNIGYVSKGVEEILEKGL